MKRRIAWTAAPVIALALVSGCGRDIPGGPYTASSPDSVSYAHEREVVEALVAEGRPNRLDLHFHGFLTMEDRTYLTVYGKSRGDRVYLHFLVRLQDAHITELATNGGYGGALLRGVEWGIRDVGDGFELVYKQMAAIVD